MRIFNKKPVLIHLIERAGMAEMVHEVPVVGTVDGYGLLHDFPKLADHFPAVLLGIKQENISALVVTQDIPEANINSQDILICDIGKHPQPGDFSDSTSWTQATLQAKATCHHRRLSLQKHAKARAKRLSRISLLFYPPLKLINSVETINISQ